MFEEEFAKLPVEPPRRVESLPGLRLRGVIPKWAMVLPLFFVVFFLFLPLSVMNTDPAMRMSMGATDTVQGRVVSVGSASACRGGASRRVVYAFLAKSGREYRAAALVCEESPYFSVKEGDAIEVRYLKSDPTVNALPREVRNEPPPFVFFLFMPIFFLGIFGAMFWPPIGEALKARRLFKSGRIANGRVVFVKRRANFLWPGMPGASASLIFVEIQSSSGVSREVVAPCHNDWLINQLAPGVTVHVAYADDKATQVALLDAYLR
jgi:Protein of unknown function (DUF3592)